MIRAAALLLLAGAARAEIITVSNDLGDNKAFTKALDSAKKGDVIKLVGGRGFVGLGVQQDAQGFYVAEVVASSPADGAGVKVGDRIGSVNGQTTAGLSVADVVARLSGPEGTMVEVVLVDKETKLPRTKRIWRGQRMHVISDDFSKVKAATREGAVEAGIKYGERCAKAGNKECMKGLMWTYFTENSAYRDDAKAFAWARALAELDDADGQHLTGYYLYTGRGVRKDLVESYKWSLKAALKGNIYAQGLVAADLAYGMGTAKDYAKAEEWFAKAIAGGNTHAKKTYDDWKAQVKAQVDAEVRSRNLPADRSVSSAVTAPQAPAPPAPGLSREEIKAMMAEALREQKAAEPKPEAPKQASSDADAPRYSKPERPADVAVVIGIEKYSSVPDAVYAERDAEAVAAHLKALGFPQRNIFKLTGTRATKSAFLKELETRLSRVATPESTVFVYFSGHGAPDPKTGDAYLMPYDGDPEFLEDTGYPLKRLYAKLGALKVKRVVVTLDSCFSGAGGRSVLAKGVRPLVAIAEPVAMGRVLALTAAKGSEISGAADEQAHGLFTYHLLSALNAGKTTLGGLHEYLKTRVADEARRSDRDQTPQLIGAGAALEDISK